MKISISFHIQYLPSLFASSFNLSSLGSSCVLFQCFQTTGSCPVTPKLALRLLVYPSASPKIDGVLRTAQGLWYIPARSSQFTSLLAVAQAGSLALLTESCLFA